MQDKAGVKRQVWIRMSEQDRLAAQLVAREWGLIESEFWRQFAGIYPDGTQPDTLRTNKLRQAYDKMREKLQKRR